MGLSHSSEALLKSSSMETETQKQVLIIGDRRVMSKTREEKRKYRHEREHRGG